MAVEDPGHYAPMPGAWVWFVLISLVLIGIIGYLLSRPPRN